MLAAIELPTKDDAVIQAARRLPPNRFAEAIRRASWAGREDGRGSAAMMRMLIDLHRAKSAARSICVTAFDMGVADESQGATRRPAGLTGDALREAVQADNIAAAAGDGQYDRVIVLAGNVHARKVPVTFGGVTYEPMAMRLARLGRLVSINARTAGGSEWGCRLRAGVAFVPGRPLSKDRVTCTAHAVGGDPAAGKARSITLVAAAAGEDAAAYDGVFDLGPVTASPPAVPAAARRSPPGGG